MACWKKQQLYGCWVLGIVFVFVKQIPVFTKIGLYPGWNKEESPPHLKPSCFPHKEQQSETELLQQIPVFTKIGLYPGWKKEVKGM